MVKIEKEYVFEGTKGKIGLKDLFDVCAAEGFLVAIAADVYLHVEIETEMRRRVAEHLAGGASATVAEIRDLLGTTRKYAVPFCEYLDRIGVTRRDGDLRFRAEGQGVAP